MRTPADALTYMHACRVLQDTDVRGTLTRQKMEELCQPVFDRLKEPMVKALSNAGLKPEDIASVEIIGSSTRIPYVAKVGWYMAGPTCPSSSPSGS